MVLVKRHPVDESIRRPKLFQQLLLCDTETGIYLGTIYGAVRGRLTREITRSARSIRGVFGRPCVSSARQTSNGQNGILNEITNIRSKSTQPFECGDGACAKRKLSTWRRPSVPHDDATRSRALNKWRVVLFSKNEFERTSQVKFEGKPVVATGIVHSGVPRARLYPAPIVSGNVWKHTLETPFGERGGMSYPR